MGIKQRFASACKRGHGVIFCFPYWFCYKSLHAEGQLGYTSVDTQPTPRRVSSLKVKVVAVAAANKHSVAVADSGEVFTWGCNKEGQLGYGTSNSASNSSSRMVEYFKGKILKHVSASKYHTIVLGADGEVSIYSYYLEYDYYCLGPACSKI